MSKMGQHIIRDAESRSLDHAAELAELRAEVERLEGVVRRARKALEACSDDLVRFADANAAGLAIGRVILETQLELREATD